MTKRGLPKLLRGPLLALGLLVLTLLVMEGSLRLIGWGAPPSDVLRLPGQLAPEQAITVWDPELYYRLRPSTAVFGRYHVNRHGYRGPEFDRARRPGTLRIVCIGDSSTFGLGVGDDETWPASLQRILSGLLEGQLEVEVINGGVPGYSTEQNKRQLARDLLPLQPDAVVACPTAQNDASWRANAGDAVVLDRNSALRARLDQWHLARLLGLGGTDDTFRATGIRPPGTPGARPRVTLEEFEDNLEQIVATASSAGAPTLMIVTEHSAVQEELVPDLEASEAIVLRAAEQAGGLWTDTRDDFAGYAPYSMYSDRIHFIALGQQLIAIRAAQALLEEPGRLATGSRSEFLAGWARARDTGLTGYESVLSGPSAPPLLTALLEALRQPDVDRRLAEGDPTLPPALLDHDPVAGRMRSPYELGELLQSPAPQAAALREQVERWIHPPSRLVTWAGGAEALLSSSPERRVLARALATFDAAIGAAPPQRDRRLAVAIEALQGGSFDAALLRLDAVLELAGNDIEALYHRGLCLRKLGRPDEALADFRRIVTVAPDSALGHYVAGVMAYERGDRATAEPELRSAIERDSTMARARFALARLLIDRGELDEAEAQLATASKLMTDPVDVTPLVEEIQRIRREGGR